MNRRTSVTHEFVEFIPAQRADGVIYVSVKYATAVHNCCCGCGLKVVTPIHPTDWTLSFDGDSISLSPSIGNWNYPCKSHYWIRKNKVVWAKAWTPEEIAAGKARDQRLTEQYFGGPPTSTEGPPLGKESIWKKIGKWMLGR